MCQMNWRGQKINFKITNKKINLFYSLVVNNLSNYRNRGTAT